jgi:trimeric autotransporter adhesin
MKTHSNSLNTIPLRRAFLGLLALTSTHGWAVNIVGNTVTTHLTVNGNTTASGWGLFKEGVDIGNGAEAMFNWWPSTALAGTASFDIKWADGTFTWRDTVTALTASNKMSLDASNILTLYKTDGLAVGLTLNPNSGITLADGTQIKDAASLRSSGLYDSNGNLAVSVAADGTLKLATGMTFGSDPNVKLNASNVAALQSTLKNLGYQENPVIGTAIKKLAIVNATVSSVTASGTFLYLVGNFSRGASVGGLPVSSAGGDDGFVAKCDSNGLAQWVKAIGGSGSDGTSSVCLDAGGNVFVGGNSSGTTTNLLSSNIVSAGSSDGYVAKFDSNGTILWAKAIGGAGYDSTASVCVDNSGNVFAGGSMQGMTTNLGAANLTAVGNNDGFVAKFDSTGSVQWAGAIGGFSYESVASVSVDGSGNLFASGSFNGIMTTLGAANLTSAGFGDGYVAKFSPTGVIQWAKAIGGGGSDSAASVSVDTSGHVFVGGTFNGTMTTLGAANLTSAGFGDGYVAKFSSTGAIQWVKAVGGSSDDDTTSVKIDSLGNVLAGGRFQGTTTNLGVINLNNLGVMGGYIAQFSSNGVLLDAISLGEPAATKSVTGLALWGSEIYAWGNAQSTFAFGNTRVPNGDFVVGWPTFRVVTPARIAAVPMAWASSSAVGQSSTALGENAYAEGYNSVALGNGIASGGSSFAAGFGRATGLGSVAFGGKALGTRSTAFGASVAAGWFSFASGMTTSATGRSSTAFGDYNLASGGQSTVFGGSNTASGNNSTVSGYGNTVSGYYASGFGNNLIAQSSTSFVTGANNLAQGTPGSWIPTDDLFVMGNGDSGAARSNAFTTLKNGQTTLTNKEWKTATSAAPASAAAALANPASTTDSDGNALVVEGHTLLKGKVTLAVPQGDISMGIYQ